MYGDNNRDMTMGLYGDNILGDSSSYLTMMLQEILDFFFFQI